MLTVIVVVLMCIGIGLYARSRKAEDVLRKRPNKIIAFTVAVPPTKVIQIIREFAQNNRYSISPFSEVENRIILGEGASWTSYGFFYPVYISDKDNGSSLIEVGIKGKVMQFGPIVSKKHKNMVNDLKKAILTNMA